MVVAPGGGGKMDKLKTLLTARPFWAALVGLVLICLAGVLPGMPEGSTEITQAVIVLAAYITLPPDAVIERLKRLAGSRKLWAAMVGLAFLCLKQFRPDFPLTEEQLYQVVALLATYILGVGISDRRTANVV
jgi:hypothetical protein